MGQKRKKDSEKGSKSAEIILKPPRLDGFSQNTTAKLGRTEDELKRRSKVLEDDLLGTLRYVEKMKRDERRKKRKSEKRRGKGMDADGIDALVEEQRRRREIRRQQRADDRRWHRLEREAWERKEREIVARKLIIWERERRKERPKESHGQESCHSYEYYLE